MLKKMAGERRAEVFSELFPFPHGFTAHTGVPN